MARARILKPGFFKNEDLADCSLGARLLFAGLWTLADRMGRLEDRPRRIKSEIFPYDDLDVDGLLNELEKHKFIIRYEARGSKYIQVLTFASHQKPHKNEVASSIPSHDEAQPKSEQDVPKSEHSGLNPLPLTLNLNPEAGAKGAAADPRKDFFRIGQEISKITGWDQSPSWTGNYGRIEQWIANGWDEHLDILPTVRRLMAKRQSRGQGPPGDLKYFEQAIADAHATRITPLPKGKANETIGTNHNGSNGKSKSDRLNDAERRALEKLGATDQPNGSPMLRQLEHLREGTGTG